MVSLGDMSLFPAFYDRKDTERINMPIVTLKNR